MSKNIAVVLLTQGSPEDEETAKHFLTKVLNDKHIIPFPQPFRLIYAMIKASLRRKKIRKLFEEMQENSPHFDENNDQKKALEKCLLTDENSYHVFIARRYQEPSIPQVVQDVRAIRPDEILLIPLYPHYSVATTGSSFDAWFSESKHRDVRVPVKTLCCYPMDRHYIEAHAKGMFDMFSQALEEGTPRVLFSAHGLPKRLHKAGDPYLWQLEQTAKAIMKEMDVESLDYRICFQHHMGIHQMQRPTVEEEIKRAAIEKRVVIMVPISYVTERLETLAELDKTYKDMAMSYGISHYYRVPTLSLEPLFIDALASNIKELAEREYHANGCHAYSASGERLCPKNRKKCPVVN